MFIYGLFFLLASAVSQVSIKGKEFTYIGNFNEKNASSFWALSNQLFITAPKKNPAKKRYCWSKSTIFSPLESIFSPFGPFFVMFLCKVPKPLCGGAGAGGTPNSAKFSRQKKLCQGGVVPIWRKNCPIGMYVYSLTYHLFCGEFYFIFFLTRLFLNLLMSFSKFVTKNTAVMKSW